MTIIERANYNAHRANCEREVARSADSYRGTYYLNRANSETYKHNNGDWNRYYTKRER